MSADNLALLRDLSNKIRRVRGLRDSAQERLDELVAERDRLLKELEGE